MIYGFLIHDHKAIYNMAIAATDHIHDLLI